MEFSYDHNCFVCGKDNPVGLKVIFTDKGDGEVEGRFTPSIYNEGFPGFLHGGLATTLMDETMARAVNTLGFHGMTARLEVRFREKIPVGEELKVIAKVSQHKKTIVDIDARVVLKDGKVAAEATGRFMIIGQMADRNVSHK